MMEITLVAMRKLPKFMSAPSSRKEAFRQVSGQAESGQPVKRFGFCQWQATFARVRMAAVPDRRAAYQGDPLGTGPRQ